MNEPIFLAHKSSDYDILKRLNLPASLYSGNGSLPSDCKGKTLVLLPIDATKEGGELIRAVQKALLLGSIPAAHHVVQFKGDIMHHSLLNFILEDEDIARITLETILVDPVIGGALQIQIPHEGMERPMVLPEGIMSGIAGDFSQLYADALEPCKEFFYFSFLTYLGALLSGRLSLKIELHPEPRFYILLLGESSDDRKSTAINQTDKFFRSFEGMNTCYGVGSAEGLGKRLDTAPHLVLVYDEFRQFLSKCRLDGSVLLPMTTSLFEQNHYENYTKNSEIKLDDVHLSLLAASTIPTWEQTFDAQFSDIGFLNRLFIVPGSSERKYSMPIEIPELPKSELRFRIGEILRAHEYPRRMEVSSEAFGVFDAWYKSAEKSTYAKRLDTYALRMMPLLAVNDGKDLVDIDIIEKTIAIMDWQLLVRKRLAPIDADGIIAKHEERIRRALSRGALGERDLKKAIHYERTGLWAWDAAIKNLRNAHEVLYDPQSGLYTCPQTCPRGAWKG